MLLSAAEPGLVPAKAKGAFVGEARLAGVRVRMVVTSRACV